MSTTSDGGSAFPGLNAEMTGIDSEGVARFDIQPSDGMSLRDYFAAQALTALISKEKKDGLNCGLKAVPRMAEWAYEYADAMLEERCAK